MIRYFITVDWCNRGSRGIFCDREGNAFGKDSEHTQDEMYEVLGDFWIILNPESLPFDEETLRQYNRWVPLAEYTHLYGIAYKSKASPEAVLEVITPSATLKS